MKKILLGLVMAIVAGQPAQAQLNGPSTGSIIKRPLKLSGEKIRHGMAKFAECVVWKQGAMSRDLVLTNRGGKGLSVRDWDEINDSDCSAEIGGRIKELVTGDDHMRAIFADALIARELKGVALPDLSAVPVLARPEANPSNGAAVAERFLDEFGECLVRSDPAGARAALDSPVGSESELAALRAMGPALSTCMPPGNTVRFKREMLRGPLAINYYRLAAASGAISPKGGR